MLNRLYNVAVLLAVGYAVFFMMLLGRTPSERGTGFMVALGLLAFRYVVRLA